MPPIMPPGGAIYSRKAPPHSREGRIAIVGSGPAGLAAAWELTRRGYSPTVFESHSVIGGMLATGIPRFRLPREVREREIQAIRDFGVDIRTGITVGRDVTFAYLKERGYRAFFLAIGAQQNNKLNIPGEELDDAVDCMSLLLALNLKVDILVSSNVAVIGGGNAAIDAARSVLRAGAKEVTIFYRRSAAEMTANAEEVEEAVKEGVKIEYNTTPVEITGDKGRVTGIRFQRTKSGRDAAAKGRPTLEVLPGTDFVRPADHVIIAIGQTPNAQQLSLPGLIIDNDTGVIKVNPLTLETSLPGVFSGGDCITGPNSVVEAMAAGLRAAESIDRYLQGHDLEEGRRSEPAPAAKVNLDMVEISPYRRAEMPFISPTQRISSFEETTTGLPEASARNESQRCLNCALCSQCLECSTICELRAVSHDDASRRFEITAEAVLSFPSVAAEDSPVPYSSNEATARDGLRVVPPQSGGELADEITRGMAVALETALKLKPDKAQLGQPQDTAETDTRPAPQPPALKTEADAPGIGVFLCRCGGSISSVIDFTTVARKLADVAGITLIKEVAQACTEAGAREIASQVTEQQLQRVVLAACRCCNLEQVCYSCTDRRLMCQQYLDQQVILPDNIPVQFCNIREQCAWVHQDDPKNATRKAVQIISSGVSQARMEPRSAPLPGAILPNVLILGNSLASTTAARALAARDYRVELVTGRKVTAENDNPADAILPRFEQLIGKGLTTKPWPISLTLNGSPGNYEMTLEYGSGSEVVKAGALLVDTDALNTSEVPGLKINGGLLERIVSARKHGDYSTLSGELLRAITIGEKAGIFLLSTENVIPADEQVSSGLATATRVAAYIKPASIYPRTTAVSIDSRTCRGCGDCVRVCPYIGLRERGDGTVYADIDKNLCTGCGACIVSCSVGAISQPGQSDKHLVAALHSVLTTG